VILDLHNADNFYHLLLTLSLLILVPSEEGRAPLEMLSADNIRFFGQHDVWTLDANKSKLIRLGFPLSASGDSLLIREVVSLDMAFFVHSISPIQ
jgi:hypothetical protein